MTLEGQTAVVTGASQGIGREISVALAENGANLVLAARSAEALEETRGLVEEQGGEALVVPTDLLEPGEVDALASAALERFGSVEVLVNNSGVEGPTAALQDISPEEWASVLDTNLKGAFLCCRALLPSMIERGAGSIVMIGSVLARRPVFGRTPYAASKLALVALAHNLATEVGPSGIRVNVVSPGAVEGPRLDKVFQAQAEANDVTLEQVREQYTGLSPLRAMVTARDVAEAVVFLAGPRASKVTGEDLNVTAGLVMY